MRSAASWLMGLLFAGAMSQALAVSGEDCVQCHDKVTPGQVSDWQQSKHAGAGVSCIDCHRVPGDSPMATQHATIVTNRQHRSELDRAGVGVECGTNSSAGESTRLGEKR